MKTLIAAVIASAVSFGAFAQSASAPMAKPMAAPPMATPMAKPMASDTMKPMASDTMKPAHKAKMHRHAAKKAMKKASAPA